MRSPSPPLINDAHFFVSGNVTIHPTAAIAPGVLLQADPDCQLVISAGTCIGVGSILHAHQGNLVIEAGVTLGSGVLIVGGATIGTNACVGSATTILNRSIEPQQMVAAGSLIGDDSRQIDVAKANGARVNGAAQSVEATPTAPADGPVNSPAETNGSSPAAPQAPAVVQVVYGRTYLERMMVTMFPHRQAAESSSAESSSAESFFAEPPSTKSPAVDPASG
jgi:carbon dioxide concentrating mechanism protein CcmN